MVLLDSRGISRVPRYSGTCPASQQGFRLRGCHPLWPAVPGRSTILLVGNLPALRPDRPYNPREQAPWFGLFRVRSPLLAESLFCFLFLWVLRWFTSPRWLPPTYGFGRGFLGMTRGGLPHSEIAGSKPVCGSPTLIAAYHVLLRLLAPRHSPYALSSLTISGLMHAETRTQDSKPETSSVSWCLAPAASAPSHCVHVWPSYYRLQDIQLSKNSVQPSFGRPTVAHALVGRRERRLVENTGLEPVTSWLQTRRSPS
jgi:hypothetical protein